jgi:N-acetylated-alpha-linked acidic dipeptidase
MCRVLISILLLVVAAVQADDEPLRYWSRGERDAQLRLEERLLAIPEARRLADWHAGFTVEPHRAGTPGDARLIQRMADDLEAMGLEVEVHRFHAYLAEPVSGEVSIIASPVPADELGFDHDPALPIELPVREWALPEDPFSANPQMDFGWNAYSGSGDVEGEVVYANYGTKEDFDALKKGGVDVTGKIVLARYGKNFRGFKAMFAEAAGASGLIMYSDPADNGFTKGVVYPDAGWANGSHIERGSILALPYSGDPLTPFKEASLEAERLNPDELALPKIPVQPIGWAAAFEIIRRMRGEPVQAEWQGGLPASYRVTGGEELRVRVAVQQTRQVTETANVIATLPGVSAQTVIIGCHHDAWGFGALDPNAGSMLVFEVARAFAKLASEGYRPRRTLVFANWGAEEYGIIGSVEWVEAHRDELFNNAVAYINLDSAINGADFNASAAPELKTLIEEVAGAIPFPGEEYATALESWQAQRKEKPLFDDLGGGSDHVGFYCHLGIPSCGMGTTNAKGSSYHSAYDNLHWFRQVMGDDYASALMVTRVVALTSLRLAEAPLLPLDPLRWATDTERHLTAVNEKAEAAGLHFDGTEVEQSAKRYQRSAGDVYARLLLAVSRDELGEGELEKANRILMKLSRNWLAKDGLTGRPWFRNLFGATDPFSGYAAWMLPELHWFVARENVSGLNSAVESYVSVFARLERDIAALETLIN